MEDKYKISIYYVCQQYRQASNVREEISYLGQWAVRILEQLPRDNASSSQQLFPILPQFEMSPPDVAISCFAIFYLMSTNDFIGDFSLY